MLKFLLFIFFIYIGIILNAQDVKFLKKIDSVCMLRELKASITNPAKAINALLGETFESTNFPPTSWDTTNVEWYHSTQTANGVQLSQVEALSAGHTGHFLVFDSYNTDAGVTASFITPRLHPTLANNLLNYKVELCQLSTDINNMGAGAKLFIEFSTDNGTTWTVSSNNVLALLPSYNTATTGWQSGSVNLAAYTNQTVRVRFRAVSDWGWCDICLDNISGPDADILAFSNEIIAEKSWADFSGLGYYGTIPNSQLSNVDFAGVVTNAGSLAQSNVTLHADINNGTFSGTTGINNPIALLDTSLTDTLFSHVVLASTVPTTFKTKLWFTQSQIDQQPLNNTTDSIYFSSSATDFLRTSGYDTYVTPYSFGTNAPAASGMNFGATYHFISNAQIDSVYINIYKNKGATSLKAMLFAINFISGTIVPVDSSESVIIPTTESITRTKFKLLFPYQTTAGSLLIAAIKMNFTVGTDTISILAQNSSFPGDMVKASRCYLHQPTGWSWNSVNFVPSVGLIIKSNTSIERPGNDGLASIFPNPATGVLHIESKTNVMVTVYNLLWQAITNPSTIIDSGTIDLNHLAEGTYFVKLQSGENISIKKISLVK